MFKPYTAYLINVDRDFEREVDVGNFCKLSTALVNARVAAQERGIADWDWIVDKSAPDGTLINRRSSVGGFEPLQ